MVSVRELRALLDKYTQSGLVVLPLRYGDKRPAAEWRYLLELPAAERVAAAREVFLQHAERMGWKLNIGLLCDRIFVLDIDDGEAFTNWLAQRGEPFPATTVVRTRRGLHFYFRVPEGFGVVKGCKLREPRADLKGWGGYVVAPPSVVGGHEYRFLLGQGLDALQEPSGWVLELLKRERVHTVEGKGLGEHVLQEVVGLLLPHWTEGARHDLALGLAGLMRKHGVAEVDAVRCVTALAAAANDEEVRNRQDAVRDTYRKPADEVAGATILLEHVGSDLVERLEQLLSAGRRRVRLLTFEEWEQHVLARMSGVWVVEGVLRQGDLAVLAGRPKAGKSIVAANLAHALSTGTAWLGLGTARCGVLYLDLERVTETVLRLRKLGAIQGVYSVGTEDNRMAVTAADLTELRALIEEVRERCGGLVVVIVDTLLDFVGRLLARRRATLNDYDAVGLELQRLRGFIAETGATFVVVHHTGKLGAGTGDERELLGSTAISAKADVLLQLYREADVEGVRRLHISGNAVEERTLYFTVGEDLRLERCDSPERTKVQWAARVIREFLQAEGEQTRQDIVRHLHAVLEVSVDAAQKLFDRAVQGMDGELYKRHHRGKLVYGLRTGS